MSWSWKWDVNPILSDMFLSIVYKDQNTCRFASAAEDSSSFNVVLLWKPKVWHMLKARERYVQQR